MGIEISQLSPSAQRQAMKKIAELERKKAIQKQEKSNNKLHAEKVDGFLIDGTPHTFASKKEYERYGDLATMLRAGLISNLEIQKRYDLVPAQQRSDGKKERPVYYVADFVYQQDGQTVVEDSKGYRDPSSASYAKFVIKRKLMLWIHNISIQEV